MSDPISVCMTMPPGRSRFVDQKLRQLTTMDFPIKQRLEVCVTCGVRDQELIGVLRGFAKHFLRTKFALSLREKLPFRIPANNPACDINTQICNVASFEKIVRTDAEVMFTNKRSLHLIDEVLEQPQVCLTFWCMLSTEAFRWFEDATKVWSRPLPNVLCSEMHSDGFFCSCFRKRDFITNGGVDERFARGFAGEDTWFHMWWRGNRKVIVAPQKEHLVIHLWHGPSATSAFSVPGKLRDLHEQYTIPLWKELMRTKERPNRDNSAWQRSEMIEGLQVWD